MTNGKKTKDHNSEQNFGGMVGILKIENKNKEEKGREKENRVRYQNVDEVRNHVMVELRERFHDRGERGFVSREGERFPEQRGRKGWIPYSAMQKATRESLT